ncbi:hypothetical protein HPP92_006678 [Vanilla planifolia]|uniref:Glycosyltransferase 2-like domain-containing protein n=1 Tax=Vanilla planifolia TaxID=51239 RepID=A0A835RCM6_VANPL|nr:hypothetical protein HPP92_006961 [Vanilla planifolia]KAG0489815.1 hypothetical protein HPP92_006678 [Vanilla planifolia]
MTPRPPNYEIQEWWNRERERILFPPEKVLESSSAANSSFYSSSAPSWSAVNLDTHVPATATDGDRKSRGRSTRQISRHVLFLLRRAASFLLSLPSRFVSVVLVALRRAVAAPSDRPDNRLYTLIRAFLGIAVFLLLLELVAYFKGWHFRPPSYAASAEALELVYTRWLAIRARYLAPPVQIIANVCVILFLVQSVDRVALMLGCFWIRLRGLRPVTAVRGKDEDMEGGNGEVNHEYPMVLLQIPMCNEREVYQQSIAAVCIQDWPRERMLVQVLDDSDDLDVQILIKAEVQKWQQKGVRILYRHRLIRTGYKAGNLKSAMSCDYVKDYEFVAIFDADFQPSPDFLKRTVPHFKGNEDLALVQARWIFVNKDENLLTRLQNINLSFHFEVEQQVNGIFINFFGFNGTAGVWRIKALQDSGDRLERTTVEDMDIAVRAHLNGWKFIFLNDVKCLCELPESYAAYKKQQHRWHS